MKPAMPNDRPRVEGSTCSRAPSVGPAHASIGAEMSTIRSCAVLGAGGFIGTNLCRRLLAEGTRVRAFGRRCLFPDALAGTDWRSGDFADPSALASAIDSVDVVFHLVHSSPAQDLRTGLADDVQANVVSSIRLLELCCEAGVGRIVFVSSGGTVYGRATSFPTPESAPRHPVAAYGLQKVTIEKHIELFHATHGLNYRILRVANPYGPFQVPVKGQGIVAKLISDALQGVQTDVWGDGSVTRDFVYIDDVVIALRASAYDSGDVIETVGECLDKPLSIRWLPGRPYDVPVSILAIDRARDTLGWSPRTPFEEGLRTTIDWWRRRLE
jgi:UDP-glucose 4-epimerase